MRLTQLHTGETGTIVYHTAPRSFRKRLLEMGFVPGAKVHVIRNAPLLDPVEYSILGYRLTLRRTEAETIEVSPVESSETQPGHLSSDHLVGTPPPLAEKSLPKTKGPVASEVTVAFVGNPNCGKTSLFNAASGSHQQVSNYAGVTVAAAVADYRQGDTLFHLVDLPGTYSLSSYGPEEKFVTHQLFESQTPPDVIVNVVDGSNLERNLYMTVQLMEAGVPTIVALNMYDELRDSGTRLDIKALSRRLGMSVIPTIGRTGEGLRELFATVARLHRERLDAVHRPTGPSVKYDGALRQSIEEVTRLIESETSLGDESAWLRPDFLAIKLLEQDQALRDYVSHRDPAGARMLEQVDKIAESHEGADETESALEQQLIDSRYRHIRTILDGIYIRRSEGRSTRIDKRIDDIVTHRAWGFPIFLLLMFLTFELTFTLGQYPMDWIESGMGWLGSLLERTMSEGPLRSLLVDGVIGGVGGVLVFLPNILILYLCISLMEDTGYLARAAFIMDRLMAAIGLHGKSFVPMLMGFGCSVPAIMGARTIESPKSRLITILVTPFMSCSARLPVYLLLVGTFFPRHAGVALFAIYLLGILVGVLSSLLFSKVLPMDDETPYVMEMPPYRVPAAKTIAIHTWERARQYLQKMATTILAATVIIWALGYFPHIDSLETPEGEVLVASYKDRVGPEEAASFETLTPERQLRVISQEQSYIGRLGRAVSPIFAPQHFDWRLSVSTLTGVAAKEVVVSTLGVLYVGDDEDTSSLSERLRQATYPDGSPVLTIPTVVAFLVFVLLYFPCIATFVAVGRETGSYKWAVFDAVYATAVAWLLSWLAYLLTALLI